MKKKLNFLIVSIEGYRGNDTALLIEPPRKMYLIVNALTGRVDDYGYKSYLDAKIAASKFGKVINSVQDLEG
jgi:hypothetical protein